MKVKLEEIVSAYISNPVQSMKNLLLWFCNPTLNCLGPQTFNLQLRYLWNLVSLFRFLNKNIFS